MTAAPTASSGNKPQTGADAAAEVDKDKPTASGDKAAAQEVESNDDNDSSAASAASAPVPETQQDRQSVALGILAALAVAHALYFARALLMPIAMAVILALLFRPVVKRFSRMRVPESVSAGLLLLLLIGFVLLAAANLVAPAQAWIDNAPENLQKVGARLHVIREQIKEIDEASAKVEQIASGNIDSEPPKKVPFPFALEEEPAPDDETGNPPVSDEKPPVDDRPPGGHAIPAGQSFPFAEAGTAQDQADARPPVDSPAPTPLVELADEKETPVPVQVQQPRLVAGLTFLTSTGTVLAEVVIVLVLTFFLLAAGDVLINNVLRILPSAREKRSTVELVHKVERGISQYLLTVTIINLLLGVAVSCTMWLLGVPTPILWGAMATLLNYIPFLGALAGIAVMFVVSVLSFDSLAYACLPPFVFWALTILEGNFITPHWVGRSMSLNPIMVFLALTFWGWMWGIGGAVLAVPILAVVKVGMDQFERTQPIGTLLGGGLR